LSNEAFVSSVLPHKVTTARLTARTPVPLRARSVFRLARSTSDPDAETSSELGFRFAAVQVGYWLGWASIVAVLAGLALNVSVEHRWLLVGSTLAAAAGNTVAMLIPWRDWLGAPRGRVLLDLWCGGLIAFVALLIVSGGSTFAPLLFLVVPFIAVVQDGRRRGFWLAASAGTCAVVTALIPLSAGATAMRLALVAAAVAVALVLVRTIRREAARAELARAHAQEASHRIKNDLQTAADLLLLGRPDGLEGTAFDVTADRLRSLAVVHRLLTEAEDRVDGGLLLRSIGAGAPVPVEVDAEPLTFDAATAQKVGIVANELVTNAFRHGAPPIRIRLEAGRETRLRVSDSGAGDPPAAHNGIGLRLVRRVVEQGLGGRFELRAAATTVGTCAEVVFPTRPQ
jgi:two-component sensor histidine kinase